MDLSRIYPQRLDWVHKGNYGSVLVVCGSKLYSGSATLAGVSALRAGTDMAVIAAPQRAADIASHTLPDLITYPLKGPHLTGRHVNDILDIIHQRRINSVVIGCGLGRHQSTISAIYKILSKVALPMVIDADGLWAVSLNGASISGKHVVLTPHLGELAILLGLKRIDEDFNTRLQMAKEAALKYHSVVLVKGHTDIVTDGAITITNNTGSPYMTKGGFGDTLSGILGALLGRGVGLLEAAHVACYINGVAGEMAASKNGEGVVASDIFEFIPKVIQGK